LFCVDVEVAVATEEADVAVDVAADVAAVQE
jgi:hypothetical protein